MGRELQPLALFGISEEELGSTAFGSALYPSDSPMTIAALAAAVHASPALVEPASAPLVELASPVVELASPVVELASPLVELASPVVELAETIPLPPVGPAETVRWLSLPKPLPVDDAAISADSITGIALHPHRLLLLPAAVLTLAAASVVCAVALVIGAVPSATMPAAASIVSVEPQANAASVADQLATVAARVRAGEQLGRNPALILGDSAAPLVASGRVDARLLLILGQSLAVAPTRVADFPAGSDDVGTVRHRMLLSSYQGLALTRNVSSAPTPEAVAAATAWLARLTGAFAPTDIELTDAGLLVVLGPDEPAGLLPAFTAAERAAS
ncbi:hypothetical protein HQQ81_01410 [Microbacteriaceae bacterium VKM Ac-2854]|nr:hypothetical protein [Microbacteriaceae bacterium VKM Ac-2854]